MSHIQAAAIERITWKPVQPKPTQAMVIEDNAEWLRRMRSERSEDWRNESAVDCLEYWGER